jgi:hypothetical protein
MRACLRSTGTGWKTHGHVGLVVGMTYSVFTSFPRLTIKMLPPLIDKNLVYQAQMRPGSADAVHALNNVLQLYVGTAGLMKANGVTDHWLLVFHQAEDTVREYVKTGRCVLDKSHIHEVLMALAIKRKHLTPIDGD